MYTLLKDIPIPTSRKRHKVDFISSMAIGDCFDSPLESRNGILTLAKRYGVKLTSRKQDDETCRFWRIE